MSGGAKFSVSMKMFGFPYRITGKVTKFEDDRLIEWQHPYGHRWRWEFEALTPDSTRVTDTFDYRDSKFPKVLELMKAPALNTKGIRNTLTALRDRFA